MTPAYAPSGTPGVAVALGSGGARGLAHIGVLRVLKRAGVPVRAVCGSSIGAVVGGLYCAGALDAYEETMRGLDRQAVLWFLDPVLPTAGFFGGQRLDAFLRALVGERLIESLPLEYTAVACDARTGDEVRLTRGVLADAMRASYAIPGLIRPHRVDGRWLSDGGNVAPVPVPAARDFGCAKVLAVDLHGKSFPAKARGRIERIAPAEEIEPAAAAPEQEPEPSQDRDRAAVQGRLRAFWEEAASKGGWARERLAGRAHKFWRRLRAPAEHRPPRISTLISDSMAIVQLHLARCQMRETPPDVLLEPILPDVGLFDFDKAERVIAEGERVAVEAWEAGAFEALRSAAPPSLGERVKGWLRNEE